jgi:hypothetical protein
MQKGKLKYFSKHNYWRIVSKKGCLYKTGLYHTFIKIKIDAKYIGCFIKSREQKENLYVEFWDTSFSLDKSIIYEIKYKVRENLERPY